MGFVWLVGLGISLYYYTLALTAGEIVNICKQTTKSCFIAVQ